MSDPATILIVEDDADLIEMLSAYFRVQGYNIMTAGWGEDALQLAADNVPDIILLDIRLPDIDGYEVCRRLRQQRATQHVPIVFLTEKRQRQDRLVGLELGAVDYITKPFDVQELRLRVRNSLRRARLNTLVNPVTGLPEGGLVEDRLRQMLQTDDWGLVLARVTGLNGFRDRYGFVAADDVGRAVSLMLTNALAENGAGDNFVGHLDTAEFVIIGRHEEIAAVAASCRARLEPAVPYFYPATDREQMMARPASHRLDVKILSLTAEETDIDNVQSLQTALGLAVRQAR